MSDRIRVHELSRELGLTNKELIHLLNEQGVEAKSHSSSIDPDDAEKIRGQIISDRQEKTPVILPVDIEEPEADIEEEDTDDDDEDEVTADGKKVIHLKPPIIVRDLANALGSKPNQLIAELMMMNVFAAINQVVEPEIVGKICANHGYEFVPERREKRAKGSAKKKEPAKKPAPKTVKKPTGGTQARPPVVAFLGHVDHGKTSLLDAIRESRVALGEAGGITQHIGASIAEVHGQTITFLDTPGHEAFTAMRQRGANATDIVVLVVAADDGIMPQTKEAIAHARAADCPIVVAMNKIDLPNANPDKALMGLQQNDVQPEDWGGDVGVVQVSAINGTGIDELLERILLEAEMLELKGSPQKPAEGLVIEAQLETGMGPTANILVRDGTLRVGDALLAGPFYGKVKALIDARGQRVKSAGPSTPVKVLGLSGVPEAGESISCAANEKEAKAISEQRARESRTGELETRQSATLEDLFRQITEESQATLKMILKTDVRGSLEAIIDSLDKIESEKIRLDIIHKSVGEITENDILLASASGAVVVGFHVRVMPSVQKTAKQKGVEVRLYSIIYELLEDIESAMRGRLEPETRETPLGNAEIKQIFEIHKTGKICGCVVTKGSIRVGASARVTRQNELIYNGTIHTLKHFKDDVKEMRAGQECGIRLDNFEDFEVGDTVEVFSVEKVAAQL
ncbi:MAG: translation initiation factor IF-2 [Lentisphaeria bacterium]|nr:translation initiation factor IF-2 [Lentisphaeria bacterium]